MMETTISRPILTDSQRLLYQAMIDWENKHEEFSSYPRASHHGMSAIYGKSSGKLIYSGFQKRTFEELIKAKIVYQTMFCGYRVYDDKRNL